MLVTHELPAGWVDTGEANRIQPSHVAGMVHVVGLGPGDLPALGAAAVDHVHPGPAGGRFAGEVAFFATAAAPGGWLICNGQTVSRATYAALFSAVGELWGAGDGVSTFSVPDLRGEFLRGADLGRGVDVGRALGTFQGDEVKSHNHTFMRPPATELETVEGIDVFAEKSTTAKYKVSDSTGYAGGVETRPRNIAMLPCICLGA